MRAPSFAASAMIVLASTASPLQAQGSPPAPNAALSTLLKEIHEGNMRRWPTWASVRGDRRYDDQLDDVTPEAFAQDVVVATARLKRARAIKPEGLTPTERVTRELLIYELELSIAGAAFKGWQQPVSPLGGPQQSLPQLAERIGVRTRAQRAAFLIRLKTMPAYVDQQIKNMRAGLAAKRTPPRVTMTQVPGQALAQGQGKPEDHALFKPFKALPEADPQRVAALKLVKEGVMPAFERLGIFLGKTYVPGCRAAIGASSAPDGKAYYAYQLRSFTTTPQTAEQIHALGLREVQRIRVEMMRVIPRCTEFIKRPRASKALFAEFLVYLRTEPRFYHRSAAALLNGYRVIAKRVDAELPKLFRRLPQLPYGVKAMPSAIAPTSPTAYYYSGSLANGTPGWFVANTHKLDQRPRYEMVPLTLHEAVPGHHLQLSLAREMKGLPEWRKTLRYTVFVEGWALYAERLGLEMGPPPRGLYADPYDDFGRLTYEMWRAMRLVVDTGIHALGWTRTRAVDYMLSHSALSRENVEREVDRYIAWPGQAVAYKTGELKIRALRAKAEQALGERFDVRGFHDAVLGQGAVPLHVLEAQVNAWIKTRQG